MKQWVLKITEYADRLLEDLDELDWPESIKDMQHVMDWTFRRCACFFEIENKDASIDVFTRDQIQLLVQLS